MSSTLSWALALGALGAAGYMLYKRGVPAVKSSPSPSSSPVPVDGARTGGDAPLPIVSIRKAGSSRTDALVFA